MARFNRIANTERLIMALRDPNGDYGVVPNIEFLDKLPSFKAFRQTIIEMENDIGNCEGYCYWEEIMKFIGDMVEEAMELD